MQSQIKTVLPAPFRCAAAEGKLENLQDNAVEQAHAMRSTNAEQDSRTMVDIRKKRKEKKRRQGIE